MCLWTRTTTVFTDGSDSVAYTKSYIAQDGQRGPAGADGANGKDGKDGTNGTDGIDGSDGKGIASTTQYFKASSSATTIPSSGWTQTASGAGFSATNRYLWTYTVTTYTDGTSSGSYTNAYVLGVWGQKGDPGDSGSAVQGRGIVSITPQYALHYSDSTEPSDGWSENIPEYPTIHSIVATGTTSATATALSEVNLKSGRTYKLTVALYKNGASNSKADV